MFCETGYQNPFVIVARTILSSDIIVRWVLLPTSRSRGRNWVTNRDAWSVGPQTPNTRHQLTREIRPYANMARPRIELVAFSVHPVKHISFRHILLAACFRSASAEKFVKSCISRQPSMRVVLKNIHVKIVILGFLKIPHWCHGFAVS